MCEIDVAMSNLMLALVIMRAVWGEEELYRTMSSSSWAWVRLGFLSFLFTRLKEKRLEKLSIMWHPGENSGSRGEKDGKIPCYISVHCSNEKLKLNKIKKN